METGAVIGGFRVGRLIGRGSRGAVYEAVQTSLDRAVALRLLEPRDFADHEDEARFLAEQQVAASLHHPGIVPTYEAGSWEGGRFVAARYIRGRTLEELIDSGGVSPARATTIPAQIEAALAAVHAAGLAHGRVSARNVLIDRAGNAVLPDLGLGRSGTPEGDETALTDLRALLERAAGRRRRRRVFAPALAAVAAVVVATGLVVASGAADEDPAAEPAPAVTGGAEALGSGLESGAASSVGCAREPGPNTPVCTLGLESVAGESARVREDGVIRGWAVRNATGDLSLQVIGFRGDKAFLRSFSQVESATDRSPQVFETGVPVKRGDLVGVTLAPGASIGTRDVGGGDKALRWGGTLPYQPDRLDSSTLTEELLLRVDIEPGASPELAQLSGREAENAPDGAGLATQEALLPRGGTRLVELTRVGNGLVIDSFQGPRRLARVEVEGTSANGRLLSFQAQCGFRQGFCLRWQNEEDDEPVVHAYRLTQTGGFSLIG